MNYSFIKGAGKAIQIFVFVLLGFLVQILLEGVTGFKPGPETPGYIAAGWNAIVPFVAGGLKLAANWLKIRATQNP